MEEKTFELLEKMYSEFVEFRNEMTEFKDDTTNKLERMENKQNRMEVIQERMEKDIKTIAEVQANHMEQNERQHQEMMKEFDKRTTLIEGAVRHLAGETVMNTSAVIDLQKRFG